MTKIEALHSLATAHIEASVRLANKSAWQATTHIQEARKLYALIAAATEDEPTTNPTDQ
jgi:hypothetical protein